MLEALVKITYWMQCPTCGTGYTPEMDPIGCDYQCEVCETVFTPVERLSDAKR